jgi:hypothetical protein
VDIHLNMSSMTNEYKLTYLDRYNIDGFSKLVSDRLVNVGFLKCEVCRYHLDRPNELYEVFDCGRNGMQVLSSNVICRQWSTRCEDHSEILCNCVSDDTGCLHCQVCTKVEIVRVNDEILSLSPNIQRPTVVNIAHNLKYHWTDFDFCQLCKYPICYAYEACFPYSASIYESSLLRLHHRLLPNV